jgi:hypothetical protein
MKHRLFYGKDPEVLCMWVSEAVGRWEYRECDRCNRGDCELCSPTLTLKVSKRCKVVLCDDFGRVVAFGREEVMRALQEQDIPAPEWMEGEW